MIVLTPYQILIYTFILFFLSNFISVQYISYNKLLYPLSHKKSLYSYANLNYYSLIHMKSALFIGLKSLCPLIAKHFISYVLLVQFILMFLLIVYKFILFDCLIILCIQLAHQINIDLVPLIISLKVDDVIASINQP